MIEFFCTKNTYNRSGHSPIFSPVASLLLVRTQESDFGQAIREINITANLRSRERKPRETLEALFDHYHKYIESLPGITFRRKRQHLEIHFLSDQFCDEDDRDATECDFETLNTAAREVAEALQLIHKRIKTADDFARDEFLQHTTALLSTGLPSTEEWRAVEQQAKTIRQAMRDSKSPWELLDVNWDKFHPDSRALLDDPFFWEATDEFAPHGNDTGADLLEDFRSWNKRNSHKSPLIFLTRLLKEWQITPVDWFDTDPAATRHAYTRDAIALNVCNQAAIAIAFAAIKFRGHCPSDVARYGVAALARVDVLFADDSIAAGLRANWQRRSQQMRARLEPFARS